MSLSTRATRIVIASAIAGATVMTAGGVAFSAVTGSPSRTTPVSTTRVTHPSDDRGRHAEPGDDRGRHAEPGDDHGKHPKHHDDHGLDRVRTR
jgi:hypothetical protein